MRWLEDNPLSNGCHNNCDVDSLINRGNGHAPSSLPSLSITDSITKHVGSTASPLFDGLPIRQGVDHLLRWFAMASILVTTCQEPPSSVDSLVTSLAMTVQLYLGCTQNWECLYRPVGLLIGRCQINGLCDDRLYDVPLMVIEIQRFLGSELYPLMHALIV